MTESRNERSELTIMQRTWRLGLVMAMVSIRRFSRGRTSLVSDCQSVPRPAICSHSSVASYDPNNPQPSHFTQVVWKATQQLGCAVQNCNGIFPAEYGVRNATSERGVPLLLMVVISGRPLLRMRVLSTRERAGRILVSDVLMFNFFPRLTQL